MNELSVDPAIRIWVFLPIVLITFLIGIIRHYIYILVYTQKPVELSQMEDSQVVLRARLLRENGKYLPKTSFNIRKAFFNNEQNGYLKTKQRPVPQNLTNVLQDMLKGNFFNVLPMVLIGGWINLMFSGFVTTKVPFPLTLRFKPMLQAGIQLDSLNAAWVSSASWYIINIFGLRPIYNLMLGEDNECDAAFLEPASVVIPNDSNAVFKVEWEALELTEYCHTLRETEKDILKMVLDEEEF